MSRPPDPSPAGETGKPLTLPGAERVLEAIMFTDIEGSTRLEQVLGTERYAQVLTRHGVLFQDALATVGAGKIEKHTGDGFMTRFRRPSDAVAAALRFQWLLAHEAWEIPTPVRVRIGIHQGEILLIPSLGTTPSTIGAPVNLAARVLNMALAGQVLLTRAVFDNARQFVKTIPGIPASEQAALAWEAYGAYLLKGINEPVEIFEVGESGRAPFRRPANGSGIERFVSAEEEATLGWRPAQGREVPKRPGWHLQKPLGEGGFGEVWLAENHHTRDLRVFKFCFDAVRLRTFKRELLIFRLISRALGMRRDIATLYEVQLETPPFFLESEYCPGGTLKDWLERRRTNGGVPLASRLDCLARIARALAAAHSVGVIHKDVKPSNIFIEERTGDEVRPRLADFGIGVVTDRSAMEGLDLTVTSGLTMVADAARSQTYMYGAPEYLVGKPPSIRGDIFALGVVLYQVVIDDFQRPLGAGWQRDVSDPLLVEDIASCVDVDPERRFSSALLLAERLETLEERRAAQEATKETARRLETQQRKVQTYRRRVRVALFSAAILFLLLAISSALLVVLHRAGGAAARHSGELEAERELARDRLYVADMQGATDDLVTSRSEAARSVINRYRPASKDRDRRGWEWFFADSFLNPSRLRRVVSAQPLRALAASPDGQFAAVAGDDGEISIWTCDGLAKVRAFRPGSSAVRSLAWSGLGVLAAGLGEGEVVLFESGTGEERKRWKAHGGAVMALAWHPTLPLLASGAVDGGLAWWRENGEVHRQVRKQGPVLAVDWEPDGDELAVILGRPGRLLVDTPAALENAHEYELKTERSAVAWRPGTHQLALSMDGKPVRVWDPRRMQEMVFSGLASASAFAWSPRGDGLAVSSIDGRIALFDVSRPERPPSPLHGHGRRVSALRWLARQPERLLSVGEDGTLCAWDDLRRSSEIVTVIFPTTISAAQWHPTENKLAVMIAGDELLVLEPGSERTQWSRPLPLPRETKMRFEHGSVAWSPAGNHLAAACAGRGLVVWNLAEGTRLEPTVEADISEVQWTADGRRLLLRRPAGWSSVPLEGGAMTLIPGTREAHWVGSLGADCLGVVRPGEGGWRFAALELGGGRPRTESLLGAEFGEVRACALSPDRRRLAIASEMGAVLWIDTASGELSRPGIAHTGPVTALGWHPENGRLATAGSDGTCRLFNIAQTLQNWVIKHDLSPECVATGWSADGRRLMLAQHGRSLRFYDASQSLQGAGKVPAPPPRTAAQDLRERCAEIEWQPGEEFGWKALAEIVRQSQRDGHDEAELLLAAARLGAQRRFSPLAPTAPSRGRVLVEWAGVPLPRAVQVAQACALQDWDAVLRLSAGPSHDAAAGWLACAQAEALEHLDRREEAEAAHFRAWQAQRRAQGGEVSQPLLPASFETSAELPGIELAAVANVRLDEEWIGGVKNNFSTLPSLLAPPDGDAFRCSDFLQLAGSNLRLSLGRMLPRSTGWMRTSRPAAQLSFLVAASYISDVPLQDTCVGSLYLLRADGGAVQYAAHLRAQRLGLVDAADGASRARTRGGGRLARQKSSSN